MSNQHTALPWPDRFWAKTTPNANGCIEWTGATRSTGYGSVWFRGRLAGAHRVSWALANGPIPDGKHVLHRCDNRRCVNPDHLFLGTNHDNVLDMWAKGRGKTWHTGATHCIRGHPFDEANTLVLKAGRKCKTCDRDLHRARYHKAKARAWLAASGEGA